jgi:hypothetical protein
MFVNSPLAYSAGLILIPPPLRHPPLGVRRRSWGSAPGSAQRTATTVTGNEAVRPSLQSVSFLIDGERLSVVLGQRAISADLVLAFVKVPASSSLSVKNACDHRRFNMHRAPCRMKQVRTHPQGCGGLSSVSCMCRESPESSSRTTTMMMLFPLHRTRSMCQGVARRLKLSDLLMVSRQEGRLSEQEWGVLSHYDGFGSRINPVDRATSGSQTPSLVTGGRRGNPLYVWCRV